MKPHIRQRNNGFRLYPPPNLRGVAARDFLRFSQEYFQALARRYGETPRFRLRQDYLEVDLSQAPWTLRAIRSLSRDPSLFEALRPPEPLSDEEAEALANRSQEVKRKTL
jgi:hypothetical protein